jgi:hypothetical protein
MSTDNTPQSPARHLDSPRDRSLEKPMTPTTWIMLAVVLPVFVALIAYDAVGGHGEVAAQTAICFEAGPCL